MLITPIACAVPFAPGAGPVLNGLIRVLIQPGTRAAAIYGRAEVDEGFSCSFELNPEYAPRLAAAGLCFSGLGEAGEVRIAELPGHRFWLGTGFLPQLAPTDGPPHPIIAAYLNAVRDFHTERNG